MSFIQMLGVGAICVWVIASTPSGLKEFRRVREAGSGVPVAVIKAVLVGGKKGLAVLTAGLVALFSEFINSLGS